MAAEDFTLGVEEEYQIIDPDTRRLRPRALPILQDAQAALGESVQPEFHASQIEIATPICQTLAEARKQLTDSRRALMEATARDGGRLAAAATHPFSHSRAQPITDKPRYRDMAHDYKALAEELVIFGCHVHVGIADREAAINVLNRARPWLATLLALSASSPFWAGADTGYASYRTELWVRWPMAGPPLPFASLAEHDALVQSLVATGSISDETKIYWDVRLPKHVPTIEFRVADVCPTVDEAVMLAGLIQALVRTCHEQGQDGGPTPTIRPEVLRAAHWRAARYGLEGELVDPVAEESVRATKMVERLLTLVRPALETSGDWAEVSGLVEATLTNGNSAMRQRAVHERTGRLEDVVDLLTEETARGRIIMSEDVRPTKVQILDETTANQIAAGEVVERPAAAVKELVENALDAGARRVLVELEEGGKYLLRVTDDGSGMGQEDAILSLQRHATSKIRNSDDLFRITTMGFRGEALPSIASVSQMTIVTKEAGQDDVPGIQLRCLGGSLEEVSEVGARIGTSITVENLFYNVPARLKFLKTAQTELGHIVELMQRFALARPDVALRLMHGTGEVFASAGSGSLMDACVQVFGRDTARHLVPLDYEGAGLRVTGYIGTPSALKGSRASQHTFVNRRFVRNKAVTRALDEAYKSVQTLHGVRYPAAVVLIEIDPSQVDVNVSPTKTEVRFTREGDIYAAVYKAVQEALMAGGLVATIIQKTTVGSAPSPAATDRAEPLFSVPSRHPANTHQDTTAFREAYHERAHQAPVSDDPFEDASSFTAPNSGNVRDPLTAAPRSTVDLAPPLLGAGAASPAETSIGADYRGHDLRSLRVLAQTRNMYILAQTDHALLLIDQHIAHERVLYEKLLAGAEGGGTGVPTQRLMLPFTLELGKREMMVVENRLEDLRRAGFEMEPFGGDSFVVRSVPASVAQKSLKAQDGPEATLRAIIDEMVEKTVSRRLLLPAEEVLITASCKMAVKAGDPLTFEEMDALIADLLKSDNPYTCPHGRPIIVELSNNDLDRKFGR